MKFTSVIVSLTLTLSSGPAATAAECETVPVHFTPPPPQVEVISEDFSDSDLVTVIKKLARCMGRNVYIGPGVGGRVSPVVNKVPAEDALRLILETRSKPLVYRLLAPNTLIVASSQEQLDKIDHDLIVCPVKPHEPNKLVRQEILLQRLDAPEVVERLRESYPRIRFSPHPTMNGFYMDGSYSDVLHAKQQAADQDVAPDEPASVRVRVPIRHSDPEELKALLQTLCPDITVTVVQPWFAPIPGRPPVTE